MPSASASKHPARARGQPAPPWLRKLAVAAAELEVPSLFRPPASGGRASAVLVLFAEGTEGPDLLLTQRSAGLRAHAGQPAFPGGAVDAADSGPVTAALREAAEEVGVDPRGVDIVARMPEMFISPTAFRVVPVLGWWRQPCAVRPARPAEVSLVERIPVSELANPAVRLTMRGPAGFMTPAFRLREMLIWGFTGVVIDRLLALARWEQAWDASRVIDLQ